MGMKKSTAGRLMATMAIMGAALSTGEGGSPFANNKLSDEERIEAINKEIERSRQNKKKFKRPKSKSKKKVKIEYRKGYFVVDGDVRLETNKQSSK